MKFPRYRETCEHGHGDRFRHISPEAASGADRLDCAGRECEIAHDAAAFANNEGAGSAACLIGVRTPAQPIVQRRDAAIEAFDLVIAIERFRRRRYGIYFQGGRFASILRRRAFGFGGASSRLMNSA